MVEAPLNVTIRGYVNPLENPRRIHEIQKKPEQQKRDTSNGSASEKRKKEKHQQGTHVDTLV